MQISRFSLPTTRSLFVLVRSRAGSHTVAARNAAASCACISASPSTMARISPAAASRAAAWLDRCESGEAVGGASLMRSMADSATAPDFAVQFFPEGGNLVAGQPNIVAFKAIDNNGYPIEVSGTVKNAKGDNSAVIKTLHDGMGSFEITPADAQDIFKATVKSAKGQTKTQALPAAITTGASLKVFNKGSRIFYQAVPANAGDTAFNDLAIIGQMGGQLVYKANLDVGEGRISGVVLMGLPIALFIAVYYLNPTYVMLLFTEEMGKQMIAAAAVLQVLGAICIKKIVNIKI